MDELQHLQVRINRQKPPNRGVLTSLLCHLIKEVSSTDLIPPAHVRESLALLEAQTVMNSFGAMFLHTLDFDVNVMIPEIQEYDTETVLSSLKFSSGQTRRAQRQDELHLALPSVRYPLGPAPVWSAVLSAIDADAESFLEPLMYPPWLDVNEAASRLFMLCTVQLYALLNDAWTLKPSIEPMESLQDAMDFWTVRTLRDYLVRVAFTATNGGLEGPVRGHRELSFRERMVIFFPQPDNHHIRKGSQWWVFTLQMGYIAAYHKELETRNEAEAEDLQTALEDIFSQLQVLPMVQAPTAEGHGIVWPRKRECVALVVNSTYYKMERIGSGAATRKGGSRLTVGSTKFMKKLEEGSRVGIPDLVALNRVQNDLRARANKARTGKALNKRKPPPRRTNHIGTSASAMHQQRQRLAAQDESDDEMEQDQEGAHNEVEQDQGVSHSPAVANGGGEGGRAADQMGQDLPGGEDRMHVEEHEQEGAANVDRADAEDDVVRSGDEEDMLGGEVGSDYWGSDDEGGEFLPFPLGEDEDEEDEDYWEEPGPDSPIAHGRGIRGQDAADVDMGGMGEELSTDEGEPELSEGERPLRTPTVVRTYGRVRSFRFAASP